jgi:hypothetical protein
VPPEVKDHAKFVVTGMASAYLLPAMKINPLPAGFIVPAQPVKAPKPPVGADWVHTSPRMGRPCSPMRAGLAPRASFRRRSMAPINLRYLRRQGMACRAALNNGRRAGQNKASDGASRYCAGKRAHRHCRPLRYCPLWHFDNEYTKLHFVDLDFGKCLAQKDCRKPEVAKKALRTNPNCL